MDNNLKQQLLKKIRSKQAVIGVFGLGSVGVPLLIRFVKEGFSTVGFDIDPVKVEKLKRGENYLNHLDISPLTAAAKERPVHGSAESARFRATTDFSIAAECDAIIISVPTPLGAHNKPDLSSVHTMVDALIPHLRGGQLIGLESTTRLGTTEDENTPKLKNRSFQPVENVYLVYSPEAGRTEKQAV